MKMPVVICSGIALLVAACGGGSPASREALPPGADQQVPASSQLPPAPPDRPHDGSIRPHDDTRGARIGSQVSAQGGQKAQKEKEERDQAAFQARRNREREERLQRAADGPEPDGEQPASAPTAEPSPSEPE